MYTCRAFDLTSLKAICDSESDSLSEHPRAAITIGKHHLKTVLVIVVSLGFGIIGACYLINKPRTK